MPHVNSSGGDDLASTDEVKVYKDEGEEEKRSSENLSEEKLGLVTETEEVGWAPLSLWEFIQKFGLSLKFGCNLYPIFSHATPNIWSGFVYGYSLFISVLLVFQDKNGGGYESGEKGSGAGGDGKCSHYCFLCWGKSPHIQNYVAHTHSITSKKEAHVLVLGSTCSRFQMCNMYTKAARILGRNFPANFSLLKFKNWASLWAL